MIRPEAEWRAHLAEGRFMIQRAQASGEHVFYPRIAEPGTGADTLEWVEASGRGTVHAVTIVRKKNPADSHNVALVDLEEGPRLMSRIDGLAHEDIRIGMAVVARIVSANEQPLLVFVPA